MFHIRPVISSEHDAKHVFVGLHFTWLISFWWPLETLVNDLKCTTDETAWLTAASSEVLESQGP